jgi:pimeloyl-ACP methyl ester carboxylesterase
MIKKRFKSSSIAYRVVGEGPPLVILHGFGGSHAYLRSLAKELKSHHRVIIPSLESMYLGSKAIPFGQQSELLCDFLISVKKEHGELTLMGNSYGAGLSWAIASTTENLVERLILVNPMPPNPLKFFKSDSLLRLLKIAKSGPLLALYLSTPMAQKDLRLLATSIRLNWGRRMPSILAVFSRRRKLVHHLLRRFSWLMTNEEWQPWEEKIDNINIPTDIIVGESDLVFGDDQAKWLKTKIEHANIHRIEQAGHMAISSAADKVCQVVLDHPH